MLVHCKSRKRSRPRFVIYDPHSQPPVTKIFQAGRLGRKTIFIRVLTMHARAAARERKEGNCNVSSSEGQNRRSLACRVAVSACEKAIYGLSTHSKKVGRERKRERERERDRQTEKTHPSFALETSTFRSHVMYSKGL